MEEKFQEQIILLENRLGYKFRNREFLVRALTHPSYAHEQAQVQDKNESGMDVFFTHYERQEFLGDAVLDLVISHLLMERFDSLLEGELSRLRASLVNAERLSELAIEMGLDKVLLFGRGERATGGQRKRSILAAAYEAVIGAIYLDGGFEAVFDTLARHYQDILEKVSTDNTWRDYKSEFQEKIQALYKKVPSYYVVKERGPQHEKTFEVELKVGRKLLGRGWGRSKKEAQQNAAKHALEKKKW